MRGAEMKKNIIGIGLMGLGIIGGQVARILLESEESLATKAGCAVILKKIKVIQQDLAQPKIKTIEPCLITIDEDEFFDTPGENTGRKGRRNRTNKKIDELLEVGQEILVQIAKEPLGTKGARVTTHLSIPGRYLVLMPTIDHLGVSRKIRTFAERKRLRDIVKEVKKDNLGVIVRTAGEEKAERELKKDFKNHLNNHEIKAYPISKFLERISESAL